MRTTKAVPGDEAAYVSRAPITWTQAHRIESRRRCYELAATQDIHPTVLLATYASAESMRLVLRALGLDPARVAREIRRVDGLATGRLVRVTVWRGRATYLLGAGSTTIDDRDRTAHVDDSPVKGGVCTQQRRGCGGEIVRMSKIETIFVRSDMQERGIAEQAWLTLVFS